MNLLSYHERGIITPKFRVRKEKILGGLLCDKESKVRTQSSWWNGQMQTKCIHAN